MGRVVGVAGGRRADLNGQFFRSAWEANIARYLNFLTRHGDIVEWSYEPSEFEFPVKRGTRFYKPDFRVVDSFGRVQYWEVKGWMDRKSKTQLKRMNKYYPDIKVIIIDKAAYKNIERDIARAIPHWE